MKQVQARSSRRTRVSQHRLSTVKKKSPRKVAAPHRQAATQPQRDSSGSSSAVRRLAILTGGGDAQGMNAAIRAASRCALARNWNVFGIRNGFYGLAALAKESELDLDNSPNVIRMHWDTTTWTIRDGGSCLGTIRCEELKDNADLAGKIAAALHRRGIDSLIVIGGNGSLQGAQAICKASNPPLSVVFVPASIDNDIPKTEMSIGVDTALNVIVDCADKLLDTIKAVNRVIVMETMGRDCGYLAVLGALASASEVVFSPELPIANDKLLEVLSQLKAEYLAGRRHAMVVVGEGAVRVRVTATEYIRNFIEVGKSTGTAPAAAGSPPWDVRVSILGHLQRGGPTSAFDRVLASRMGAKAVDCIATGAAATKPQMMCLDRGQIGSVRTEDVIDGVKQGKTAVDQATLKRNSKLVRDLSKIPPWGKPNPDAEKVGILTSGADAPGMNMVLRAVARLARNLFKTETIGFLGGFTGVIDNKVRDLTWEGISETQPDPNATEADAHRRAGSILGTRRHETEFSLTELKEIEKTLRKHKISSLIVVGGLSGAQRALQVSQHMQLNMPAFRVVFVPASIDHGLPGTHATVGYDSALNVIVDSCDHIIDTGQANNRVSIVETMGGDMGALALPAALACGAELALVPEAIVKNSEVDQRLKDLAVRMKTRYAIPREHATILVKDDLCPEYSTKRIKGNAEMIFDQSQVRVTELGYTQRGGRTSYFDRLLGTLMGVQAVEECLSPATRGKSPAGKSPPAVILQLWGGEIRSANLQKELRGWGRGANSRRDKAKKLWMYDELDALFDTLSTRPEPRSS